MYTIILCNVLYRTDCFCNHYYFYIAKSPQPLEAYMLEMIAAALIIVWGFGLLSSYSMGGLIHILLVVAVIVILIRFIQGRRL